MELSYWESRWRKDKIGFHMEEGYPGLRKHWDALRAGDSPSVLVPLCGKTPDLLYLEEKGAAVIGVEYSEKAIHSFFTEQERSFEIRSHAGFRIYHSGNIKLWQGDFMKFPAGRIPDLSLIYDKAAFVALPSEKRKQYAQKLLSLCSPGTAILLHHFVYPQDEMPGPPFSVSEDEIESCFAGNFTISVLEQNSLPAERFPPFQRRGLKSPVLERLLYITKSL